MNGYAISFGLQGAAFFVGNFTENGNIYAKSAYKREA
jgi:hypothetical protein